MIIIIELIVLLVVIWVGFWQASLILAQYIGAPSVYASDCALKKMFDDVSIKPGDLIIDLGCGNAKSLIIASKNHQAKGIGVEGSPYCYLISKIKVLLSGNSKNIKIIFGSFSCVENQLKKADFVYIYLSNPSLKKIEPWLFEHIGTKTKVLSLAFVFPNKKPERTIKVKNLGKETSLRVYTSGMDGERYDRLPRADKPHRLSQ